MEHRTIQAKHYDLGSSPELLIEAADVLERQILAQIGLDDLRVPTGRKEAWGRGTRRHAQSDWIEHRLTASGWRAVDRGDVLRVPGSPPCSARPSPTPAGCCGRAPSRPTPWPGAAAACGSRKPRDVEQYIEAAGVTLAEIGAEVGLPYHQVWALAHELGVFGDDRRRGEAIALTSEAADRLRTAAAEQLRREADAVPVTEAARQLDLPVATVETLLRQGQRAPQRPVPKPVAGT